MTTWKNKVSLATGVVGYVATCYLSYKWYKDNQPLPDHFPCKPPSRDHFSEAIRMKIFSAKAPSYDQDIGFDEFLFGINRLRMQLITAHASGKVLEVAAGTARNLRAFYRCDPCTAFWVTDLNENMLKVAQNKVNENLQILEQLRRKTRIEVQESRRRFEEKQQSSNVTSMNLADKGASLLTDVDESLFASRDNKSLLADRSENQENLSGEQHHIHNVQQDLFFPSNDPVKKRIFIQQMDAQHLHFPHDHFDTVVDTFGLCSVENPVLALNEMSRVCKPGGKILLLEHGRTAYSSVNEYLTENALDHTYRWGCIWDRNIEVIVAKANVRVVEASRHHLGFTYMYVLEPVKE